jgi:hypothetical protein
MYLLLWIELSVLALVAMKAGLVTIEQDLSRQPSVRPHYDMD